MKELTIEQKAQRYDEAIEKAKGVIEQNPLMEYLKKGIEYIFPELKESEDEKIRQFLIHEVTETSDEIMSYRNMNKEDVLAWLKKQGEQKHADSKIIDLDELVIELEETIGTSPHSRETIKDFFQRAVQKYMNCLRIANGEIGRLVDENCLLKEKQGEQKRIDKIQLGKKYKCIASPRYSMFVRGLIYRPEDKFLCSLMNLCSDCFEPIEDGVQKPADKVEPKFKIGDWVVSPTGVYWHIDRIENNRYEVTSDTGTCADWPLDTDLYHLWTIQDAKPGDVLTYNDSRNNVWVCIFKEYANERIYDYCTLDKESFWEHGNWNYLASFSYTLATKEQRDLLFKKIHEAGYEWNAEKKELKKIEQKQVIDYSDSFPKDNWELIHEFVNKFGRIPKDEDELNVLIEYVLRRQKLTEWSEEDVKMIGTLIAIFEVNYPDGFYKVNPINTTNMQSIHSSEIIKWLKSLKDRVQPQPKQEWSEEEIENCAKEAENNNCIILAKHIRQLKSFRLQNNWKPSDEEMKALADALSLANNCGEESAFDLRTLYEQLKKLREE